MLEDLFSSLPDNSSDSVDLMDSSYADSLNIDIDDAPLNGDSFSHALQENQPINVPEHVDMVTVVDNFVNNFEDHLNITGWYKDFINRFSPNFSEQEIAQSVKDASDFFHIDEPIAIVEDTSTGVYINDSLTPIDDILIFSKEQLRRLGITEKNSLDLVMTHEGAHRMLQGIDTGFNSHQEELCCDYMAGVRAGLNNIDLSPLENSLSEMDVSVSHPGGVERIIALELGREFAVSFIQEHGMPPTFDDCLAHFTGNTTNNEQDINIDELQSLGDDVNNGLKGYSQDRVEWLERQARISSGLEQKIWLEKLDKEVKHFSTDDSLDSNDSIAHGDFFQAHDGFENLKGFSDDKAYHLRKANEAKENAEWHEKRVDEAIHRGDLSSARDHQDRAASYRRKQQEEIEISKKCTK